MWKTIAKIAAWIHVQSGKTKPQRIKRQVAIDAELSKSWVAHSYGSRDFYTAELSQWLKEKHDRVTIDELVEWIHTEREFIKRARNQRVGATKRYRRRY